MKTRSKAFIWILAVFIAGGLFGTALTAAWVVSRPPQRAADPRPPWRQPGPGKGPSPKFIERMASDLELEPEQRRRVAQILEESRRRYHRLNQDHREKARTIRREVREQIRAVLSPEQFERFEQLLKKRRRRGRR